IQVQRVLIQSRRVLIRSRKVLIQTQRVLIQARKLLNKKSLPIVYTISCLDAAFFSSISNLRSIDDASYSRLILPPRFSIYAFISSTLETCLSPFSGEM